MSFTIQSPTAEFSCPNFALLFLNQWNELAPRLNSERLQGGDLAIKINDDENPVDLRIRKFVAIHEFGSPSKLCDFDGLSKRYEFHLSGITDKNKKVKLQMKLIAQSDDDGESWYATLSHKLRYLPRSFLKKESS